MIMTAVRATIVPVNVFHASRDLEPGSVAFDRGNVWFTCPCGCGDKVKLDRPSITGDKVNPTVRPAINTVRREPHGQVPHWHGFLTDGVFEPS